MSKLNRINPYLLVGCFTASLISFPAMAEKYDLPVADITYEEVEDESEDIIPVVKVSDGDIKESELDLSTVDEYGRPMKKEKAQPEYRHTHKKKVDYHVDDGGQVSENWRDESSRNVKRRIKKQEKERGLSQVATYDVKQGGNIVIPIAQALLNRIQTPFSNVKVLTANNGEVFTEEGDVYVAVPDTAPLNLILSEDGVPESSVSVTLVPKPNVPPTMAHIHIPFTTGTSKMLDHARASNTWKKEESMFKSDSKHGDHISSIKRIMKPLPLGETPSGFNLVSNFEPNHKPCDLSFEQIEGQRLEGARHTISVYLVKNLTSTSKTFYEEACYQNGVLAAAVYPLEVVPPGGQTELYLLRGKSKPKMGVTSRKRPSLLEH